MDLKVHFMASKSSQATLSEAMCTFSFGMLDPRGDKAAKLKLSLAVPCKAEESFDLFCDIS